MAKLQAPLLSLGASGALGKAIVFFGWKGIDVARSYVVPANPRTDPQVAQRGRMTDAVDHVHTAQGLAADPLAAADVTAYAVYASTLTGVMTWFNATVRQFVKQRVAALFGSIYRDGFTTPAVDSLLVGCKWTKDTTSANDVTAGVIVYGTSPTALVNSMAAVVAAGAITATILALTTGVKYFWQFRSTAHNDFDGTRSGIYSGTAG